MAIIRWKPRTQLDPFRDLLGIQDEINRLFDVTVGRLPRERAGLFEGEWGPAVDVYEDDDKVVVTAELPGMAEKDIDVNIMGDTLTIKGEKKKVEEHKEKSFFRVEREYGSFQRSITLPTAVNSEGTKASFKDGVLEIDMPKKEEAKPKQIKVDVN